MSNLVIEHLKRFQCGQERIERKLDEVNLRMANLESGQACVIQHIGHLALADAQQLISAAGFDQRLERIERRLELV